MAITKRTERTGRQVPYTGVDDDNDCAENPDVPVHHTPLSRLRRTITVEPVIFLTFLVFMILATIRVQFIHQDVASRYNYSHTSSNHSQGPETAEHGDCAVNKSDPNYILDEKVQQIATYWLLSLDFVVAVLSFFSTTFLGSFSENGGGRRVPLLISSTGYMLYVACLLTVIAFELPLEYLFIGAVISGVSGNSMAIEAISNAIVADITTEEQRTSRLVILEFCVFLSGCASQLGIGYWIGNDGFLPPMWFTFAISVLLVVYVAVWITDTAPRKKFEMKVVFQEQYRGIGRLFSQKHGDVLYQLVVVSVVLFIVALVYTSFPTVIILYILAPPFCFTSVYIGYFSAVLFTANGLGLMIGGKLLPMCMDDIGIAMISYLSYIGSILTTAFAQSPLMVTIAQSIGAFGSLGYPVLKSRISKLVRENEQGIAFSFLLATSGIAQCIAPVIFNTIYASTIDFMPNFVFFCYILCYVIVLILLSSIQIRGCRRRNNFLPLDDSNINECDDHLQPVIDTADDSIG